MLLVLTRLAYTMRRTRSWKEDEDSVWVVTMTDAVGA